MLLSYLFTSIIVGLGGLIATLLFIPKLNGVIRFKKLMDEPNARSSHLNATPNLGGISFYVVIMLSFYFLAPFDHTDITISLIPGLTIIFILGLKDDLIVLAPLTKLIGQLLAALFLVFHYRFSIESLHGFMGIQEMTQVVAMPLAVLIMIAVMNAINLIDGIDGLAATISLIIFTMFGYSFYLTNKPYLVLLCITMIGTLVGFLYYNLNKKCEKKTFMGDTGSMILGFLIAALSIRFLAMDSTSLKALPLNIENLPIVVVVILIVPFFDTGRVFILRIMKKKSPFQPDRNHIHHILIDRLKISHRRASFFIGLTHFGIVLLFGYLAVNTSQGELLIVFALVILAAIIFFFLLNNPDYLRLTKKKTMKYFQNKNNKS